MSILMSSCYDDKFDIEVPEFVADDNTSTDNSGTTSSSSRNEQYRPQIHYTPSSNWINDPNGLVYLDGTYHMFYQYNPSGNEWGNMSWGHATSTDLIHWVEQTVALTRDDLGDVFSGSCVVDAKNTAGFGANAIIALYTANGDKQQQALAYSTDGAKTFSRYAGNPVITNTTESDFRDPKVFWHEESSQWIMALAMGWKYKVEFWGSKDLKNWSQLSDFSYASVGCNRGQWECPDLMRMKYNGKDKWVLIVSVNPGAPAGGSGTQYFVGDFDGKNFVAEDLDYPLWLDYGPDNYAGVTYSNVGDRNILTGWMNNWNYCSLVPCSPWRSAMTLPRELKLVEVDGKPMLSSSVVAEIEGIAEDWTTVNGKFDAGASYELSTSIDLTANSTMTLSNDSGQEFVIEYKAALKRIIVKRTSKCGDTSFSGAFSIASINAPINIVGNSTILNIYVDQSSVEIFTEDGTTAITCLVYPSSIYNKFTSSASSETKVRNFKSIWQ
jgi:fructan beta-fructosidase